MSHGEKKKQPDQAEENRSWKRIEDKEREKRIQEDLDREMIEKRRESTGQDDDAWCQVFDKEDD